MGHGNTQGLGRVLAFLLLAAGCEEKAAPYYMPGSGSETKEDAGGTEANGGSGGAGPMDAGAGSDAGTDGGMPDASLPSQFSVEAKRMYVIGTLVEGAAWLDVICDPSSPNIVEGYMPGFYAPAGYFRAQISPLTGEVFYIHAPDSGAWTLRTFREDPVLYEDDHPVGVDEPEANDTIVPTDSCPMTGDLAGVSAFQFSATGELYVRCRADEAWFGPDGEALAPCPDTFDPQPRRIDENGVVLCSDSVVSAAGVVTPIPLAAHELNDFFVQRAKPGGGFWAVREEVGVFQRWTIGVDGTAVLDGTYAASPMDWRPTNANVSRWGNIDGEGAFYRWGSLDETSDDSIVKFSADFGSSEVMYDEATDPRCRLHAFTFLTGP